LHVSSGFFRGKNEAILANLLCSEDDYNIIFKNTLKVYEKIKSYTTSHSDFIPLAAYIIAKEVPFDMYDHMINRVKEFYKTIKKSHYWTTSARDYIFLISLAISDVDIEKTCRKIDYCYNYLKNIGLPKGVQLQTLSYIIAALGEINENNYQKIISICGGFKEKNLKLGNYVIPSLGILALIDADFNDIAQEIKEAGEYLKTKKGYGFLGISNDMRMLLVVTLICDIYLKKEKNETGEVSGTEITAAQRLSILAAACSIAGVLKTANS